MNFENKYIYFQEIAFSLAGNFIALQNNFYKLRRVIIINNFVSY